MRDGRICKLTVPGIFLAAGEGKRFGDGKLQSLIDSEPLVVKSLRGPLESSLNKIIVVLGFQAEPVREAVRAAYGDHKKITFAENPGFSEGMISSFNTGLAALKRDETGAMMLLADMPFVSRETIDMLIRAWDGKSFLIPETGGKKTHPRIVPSSLFPDFTGSGSRESGKEILNKYKDLIKTVSFGEGSEFRDVDRKEDIPGF